MNEPVELPDRQDGVPACDRMSARVWQNRDIMVVLLLSLSLFSNSVTGRDIGVEITCPRRAGLITSPCALSSDVEIKVVERILTRTAHSKDN